MDRFEWLCIPKVEEVLIKLPGPLLALIPGNALGPGRIIEESTDLSAAQREAARKGDLKKGKRPKGGGWVFRMTEGNHSPCSPPPVRAGWRLQPGWHREGQRAEEHTHTHPLAALLSR